MRQNAKSELRNSKQNRSSKREHGLAGATPLWLGGHWSQWLDAKRRRGDSAAKAAHSIRCALLCASLLLALSGPPAATAQFALDWWTAESGGGTSTGGVYSVTGTIGQPDAGPTMTGWPFTLHGGFWSVIAAVQTPGAPYLTVFRAPTNTVVVSWPLAGAVGWVLQATNALPGVSAPWPVIPPPYQTNGTNLHFTEPMPVGSKFYRLHKP